MQDLNMMKSDSPKIQSNVINLGMNKMSESNQGLNEFQEDSIIRDEDLKNSNTQGLPQIQYEELYDRISKLESENMALKRQSVSKDLSQTKKLIEKVTLVNDDSSQMNYYSQIFAQEKQSNSIQKQNSKTQVQKQNYEIMMLRKEIKKKKEFFEELDYKLQKETLSKSNFVKGKIGYKDPFVKVNAFKEIEQIVEQVSNCLKIPELKQVVKQLKNFNEYQTDEQKKLSDLSYKQLMDQFVTLQQENEENLNKIDKLEEKLKFESESLERFLKKAGKSSIIDEIEIYEQLPKIRYVKTLSEDKDQGPQQVDNNTTQDEEKDPLQNYSGLIKELEIVQNLFNMRIGQEFNMKVNQIQDESKTAQTLEEMMVEFQMKFQSIQSQTARQVIGRCIKKPVDTVDSGTQAEGDDIFKSERIELETQFKEKQHAYMEIKMENQMIQKSLDQLKKEKMEQGYDLTNKNNMLTQERDEKRDLLSEKTSLEKQVERHSDMVKKKEAANEKLKSKINELELQIGQWKGKYESCYYSWEQNKEQYEEMEQKCDEMKGEISKKQARVTVIMKEKTKLQEKIQKIQKNLDKGMLRFTKRVKKVKSKRSFSDGKDEDENSSVFTEESFYEYPKAELGDRASSSLSGIASALTDKEYLKVVTSLGVVEKQLFKQGATVSEEEARAQILAWFDSEPERANIDESKKEEMLSHIASELWAKIKSKTSSFAQLKEIPTITNQNSESSKETTPKMKSKLLSKMASIQHIQENPSMSQHSLLNMNNLDQKKTSTRIQEEVSTLNASTQRLVTQDISGTDEYKIPNNPDSKKVGFQNQQINMLVDANYRERSFKTNINNILDVEDEETSRSAKQKIAVFQRDNEIPEHKVQLTQSVQTEITGLKFKIMSKSDFKNFSTQTQETYFPYDPEVQAAINNVLGRKVHHSADRYQSVQSAYNQTQQEEAYFYHHPGLQIAQKNKVIKKMFKPKISMISKTILNEHVIHVQEPVSSMNIQQKESSYRQSTEFEKNLLHMNDLELKLDSDVTNTINLDQKSNSHDPTLVYQNAKSTQQYSPRFGAMKSASKLTYNRRTDSSMVSERNQLKPTLQQNKDISQAINLSFDEYKMNEQALSHLIYAKKHVLPIKYFSKDQKKYMQSSVVNGQKNLQQNDQMHEDLKNSLSQNPHWQNSNTIEQVECESQTVERNKESLDEPEIAEGSNDDADDVYKVFVLQDNHDLANSSIFNDTQTMTKTKQTGFGTGESLTRREDHSQGNKDKE